MRKGTEQIVTHYDTVLCTVNFTLSGHKYITPTNAPNTAITTPSQLGNNILQSILRPSTKYDAVTSTDHVPLTRRLQKMRSYLYHHHRHLTILIGYHYGRPVCYDSNACTCNQLRANCVSTSVLDKSGLYYA